MSLENKTLIPTLFVVYYDNQYYYYTNEEYAKKQLFDLTMKFYNTEYTDEEETEEPYLEAFGKGFSC